MLIYPAGVLANVGFVQRRWSPVGDKSYGRHGKAVGHPEAGGWSGQNLHGCTHAPGELIAMCWDGVGLGSSKLGGVGWSKRKGDKVVKVVCGRTHVPGELPLERWCGRGWEGQTLGGLGCRKNGGGCVDQNARGGWSG